ncbi:MAG: recombinase family protein [Clostridia bacterium]|nr:recombinase family protein [Clostridia bacterium]
MQRQVIKRQVQVIQPTINTGFMQAALAPVIKKRVAAYARVSTEHEEQQTSYEAQVDYYTKKIKERTDWIFVEVYTDKGITGTNTKRREGFNRMVQDALDGKIDLILTKSVSRFARNTVDTLTTIRKLKERSVAVYFEEQSINTLDGKGELLITIMSSIAQEESRSISDNVTWGQRKRFADGKVSVGYKHFLGYEKGEDGLPQIVEEEAKVVRYIYREFLLGKTGSHIAKTLTQAGIPTPAGKTEWQASTVMSILQNEKYKGAALLQKQFTIDFLEKKMKVNEGEVPQYYIEHSHEPIIDPVDHDRVQLEIGRRKRLDRRYSSAHLFSARVICGDCGGFYGRKLWHSNDVYRSFIWQCNDKYKKDHRCRTPHLTEEKLKGAFVEALNQRMEIKEETLAACRQGLDAICDITELESGIRSIQDEIAVLVELSRQLIEENSRNVHDQEEYQRKHAALVERYEEADGRLKALQAERNRRVDIRKNTEWFMEIFSQRDGLLEEFDESLFFALTDVMMVYHDGRVAVRFRDGVEIEVVQAVSSKTA